MIGVPGVAFALLTTVLIAAGASATVKDDLWYNRLANELGAALPDGSGVTGSQVENDQSEHYTPHPTDIEFAGKTFNAKSGATGGNSTHARGVGYRFYGNSRSVAPGVTTIDVWEADDWATSGFLNTGTTNEPNVEIRSVQNHSWIGGFETTAQNTEAIRRFDYSINRDNYVAVVGMNNGDTTTIPSLMGHSFNAISVGRKDGNHSHGFTSFDTIGRIKPDIIVPETTVSRATPWVSSTAALLLDAGAGTQAENSEAIKAIILAGATKHEFSDWDRTSTRPLDDTFGAGELNVYRSYHILDAGEQESSAASEVGQIGWDFETSSGSNDQLYFFSVDNGDKIHELSVALTWNRIVTDGLSGGNWGNPQSSLANLSLELWNASNFNLSSQIDLSDSPVDNVEHIYQQQLAPGQYAIRVLGGSGTDYALAWSGTDYGLAGDVNLDGQVTGDGSGLAEDDDVTAFVEGWGWEQAQSDLLSWKQGDLNQDGLTNLSDFVILRDSIGAASGASLNLSALLSSSNAVPEPSSVVIAGMGLVSLGAWVATRRYLCRATS
ncbi:MAG: hypothetical protein ACR2NU_12830 [Aeoliella sp.]